MKETADLIEDAPPDLLAAEKGISPGAAASAAPVKYLHPAVFGLLIIPFGIVTGYVGVTLPRVFEQQGETTIAIASFQAFAMQPHSFKFVIEPALDARWRKRSWFVWSIVLTALLLPIAV